MSRFLLTALIVAVLSLGGPLAPPAQAATTTCTTTVSDTTIKGNLVVPAEQACNLDHVTVNGNITVETGARLRVIHFSTINGKLTATNIDGLAFGEREANTELTTIKGSLTVEGGHSVDLYAAQVGGAVSLTGLDRVDVDSNRLDGKLTVSHNDEVGFFRDNQIKGKTTVDDNNDVPNLFDNQIKGRLSCSGNGSVNGSGNTATGGKFGQCANL